MCLAAVFPQPGGGGRALPVRPSLRPIQVIEIAGFDLFLALFGKKALKADRGTPFRGFAGRRSGAVSRRPGGG